MEQHGALQLGGPERAPFNGANEDPRTTVAKQLNTELASPPGGQGGSCRTPTYGDMRIDGINLKLPRTGMACAEGDRTLKRCDTPIEGQLLGGQIQSVRVSIGSTAGLREVTLDAVDLPVDRIARYSTSEGNGPRPNPGIPR